MTNNKIGAFIERNAVGGGKECAASIGVVGLVNNEAGAVFGGRCDRKKADRKSRHQERLACRKWSQALSAG